MKLIDADDFIKYAKERLDICADDLIAMIEDQPTAYDINKIIEQLEETFDRWGLDEGKKTIMRKIVKEGAK